MFEVKGANIYDSPNILFQGGKGKTVLQSVDASEMCHRNKYFRSLLESEAIEIIRDTYLQYTSVNRSAELLASK